MLRRRLVQLFLGLFLFGFSTALMVRAGLGLNSWDVLHQGLAYRSGWSIGAIIVAAGAFVLLLWVPLRQRPGFGTVANIVFVGLAANLGLALLPEVEALAPRILLLLLAVLLNGLATGAYLGAGLGPGPRDGLMTGLVERTGWSIRAVRGAIELSVVAAGWTLGGTVGAGTILYALAIGPLVQIFLPPLTLATAARAAAPAGSAERLEDGAP